MCLLPFRFFPSFLFHFSLLSFFFCFLLLLLTGEEASRASLQCTKSTNASVTWGRNFRPLRRSHSASVAVGSRLSCTRSQRVGDTTVSDAAGAAEAGKKCQRVSLSAREGGGRECFFFLFLLSLSLFFRKTHHRPVEPSIRMAASMTRAPAEAAGRQCAGPQRATWPSCPWLSGPAG